VEAVVIELRSYQAAAVSSIEREFESVRATLIEMATGLGKTVVFSALCSRVVTRGGRCLVLAHREELLAQAERTARAFGMTTGIECGWRHVDPRNIPDATIASVQSLRGKRLETFAPDAFALVVVDEAHHATARSYRTILDHFANAKVLGVSATPERLDRVGLRTVFESVAFRMGLRQGIEQGWLCPLELRSVRVEPLDLSGVRTVHGDLHAAELETELTRDAVLHEIARPLAELSAGRPTLAFTAGVDQAHRLADVLAAYGVRAAAVDGSMCSETRASVLADYRAARVQVVCNCALWTEGFDASETSCIALIRPTRSRSLLLQMLGRGTRRSPETGKTSCLAIDFVPGRFSKVRLASPADALAGEELPDDVLSTVRSLSTGEQREVFAAIEAAQLEVEAVKAAEAAAKEAERATRLKRLRQVDVRYAVAKLDLASLLEIAEPEPSGLRDASMYQIDALRKAGLNVRSDLSRAAASKLLDMVQERRAAGLCSIKQARKLRGYGLPDDVSFAAARTALDAIAGYGWKPPQQVLSHLRAQLVLGDAKLPPGIVAEATDEARAAFHDARRRLHDYMREKGVLQ
jgi:superfamily II DNA or RNA helicase